MQGFELSTTAYIHEGLAFDAGGNGTIAASGTYTFVGSTGSKQVHFHGFSVKVSKGPVTIELIESPTVTVAGTLFVTPNRNRNSANVPMMKSYRGSTVTGGSVIATRKIFDVGGGAHIEGGDTGPMGEWVLKNNTSYGFRITNGDTNASCDFEASFFYYELEDK